MREQRRLAAIVSADVAGYSRLMARDESGTLVALKALRCEVVDPGLPPTEAHRQGLPAMYGFCEFPNVGGLISYGANLPTHVRDRGRSCGKNTSRRGGRRVAD